MIFDCLSIKMFSLSCEGCEQFSHLNMHGTFVVSSIEIVRLDSTTTVGFDFSARGTCTWNGSKYTVRGDNWLSTGSNPGSISVLRRGGVLSPHKTLQV